ncbi:MAG TPA: tetratricopeptide repeat protein [Sedimenticola sp.]|nr:tetratricopeptide repeat protein [Sedimenticola sp.]
MYRFSRLVRQPAFHWFLIAVAVAVGYGHTLDVPFYLDDHLSIGKNPAIRSLDPVRLWHYSPRRVVGYYTLALNYHFHGLEPAGYHLINLVIHGLAAWLVWGLARALLRTEPLRRYDSPALQWGMPLTAALIFALHPLQTQAVTYIVQRLASLAALWYLAALLCYVRLRLAHGWRRRTVWLLGFSTAALLAFFTKENSFTLPMACWLVEIAFFPRSRRNPWMWGLAAAALVAALALLWGMSHLDWPWLRRLDAMSRETAWFGRGDYLAAQMKVLWWYLRLFFLPVGLRLDYGFHQPPSWSDPSVLVSAGGHILLIGAAVKWLSRYPLPAFGILFYYTAQLVESSVIPIKDLVFEHRTYLPNAGLALAVAWFLTAWLPARLPRPLLGYGIGGTVIFLLALLTWQRNDLWRDPVRFWEDNVRREPKALRPKLELAREYFDAGRVEESLRLGKEIAASTPWPTREHLPESVTANLAAAYFVAGRSDLALRVVEDSLRQSRLPMVRQRLLLLRGNIHHGQGRYAEAEADYRRALALGPDAGIYLYLAEVLLAQRRYGEAAKTYRKVLALQPENRLARQRLAQLRGYRARPSSR